MARLPVCGALRLAASLTAACGPETTTSTSRRSGGDSPPVRGGTDGGTDEPDPPPRGAGGVGPITGDAGGHDRPSGPSPYPSGPYGTSMGDTMPDLWFIVGDGSEITWREIRSDTSVKVIVWGSGAGWCGPCIEEAAKMTDLHDRYGSQGVYVLESLFEDGSRWMATPDFVRRCESELRTTHPVAAEPHPPCGEADATPMLRVVDAETMEIVHYGNGLESGVESVVRSALDRSPRREVVVEPAAMGAAENRRPDGSRWDQLSLVREADDSVRAAIMRSGTAPAFEDLVGWEFAGINTAWIAGLGGVRKFKKGFYEGPPRVPKGPEPFVQGYNIPVRQNGVGNPHVAKPSDERPKRFGFYRVHRVQQGARDSRYPNALLLDYSLGGNFALDPSNLLRDYLVQVYPDDPELLLGHAFIALLGMRFSISYFVLRRMNQHDFRGE